MLIEAVISPLTVKTPDGQTLTLLPGRPMPFPDDQARKLLARGKGKVRLVAGPVTIEPAFTTARPVYWERMSGEIAGPARVTHVATTGLGPNEQFWVVVAYQDLTIWVRSDRLRSRPDFEARQRTAPPDTIITPNTCWACRGHRFWRSLHGATLCAGCHPPASPEVVAEWSNEEGTSR